MIIFWVNAKREAVVFRDGEQLTGELVLEVEKPTLKSICLWKIFHDNDLIFATSVPPKRFVGNNSIIYIWEETHGN